MNAPYIYSLPPDDPAVGLKMLRARFPDVTTWFGAATRHWWALIDDRLVEADTPTELARMLDSIELASSHRPGSPGLHPAGPRESNGSMKPPTVMRMSTAQWAAHRTRPQGAHRRQRERAFTPAVAKAPRRQAGSWMPTSTHMAY
ncbi:hypothetical protein GCM10009780_80920 [Actinomadura alba]